MTKELKIISKQAAFENSLTSISYKGVSYSIDKTTSNGWQLKDVKYIGTEPAANDNGFSSNLGNGATYSYTADNSTKKLTVKSGELSKDITVNFTKTIPLLSLTLDSTAQSSLRVGQKVTVTASSYLNGITNSPTYSWSVTGGSTSYSSSTANSYTFIPSEAKTYTVTCTVKDGGYTNAVSSGNTESVTVTADPYTVTKYDSADSTMAQGESQTLKVSITGNSVNSPEYTVKWSSSNTSIAAFENVNTKEGKLVAGNKSGSTKVTATVTFLNKEYTVDFGTVKVSAADATLESITNGKSDYLSDDSLESIVAEAINKVSTGTVRASDISTIKVRAYPSHVELYEDEVKSAKKITSTSKDLTTVDYLYFDADEGYIGTSELVLDVTLTSAGSGTITVTLYIPVTSDGTVKETVTGTTASSSVSFDVDDVTGGDYLYIYGTGSKTSFSPSNLSSTSTGYDGYWDKSTKSGWALFDDDDTVTIPASKFSSGKVTLYVVSLDSKGVASAGTIEVSQKDYSIKYSVVAGESVSFEQDDFEDFLEEYADDNISTSKGDYFEFDYVKFSSLPTSANGVLYEGSDKVKTSDEISDLDEVSFDSGTKAKDSITIPFTLYAKRYDKNDKVVDKKVTMSGSVVISVVKEDIVYTVGVNSSVKFDDDDFQDYLNDYSSSYRKSTLSYVTFEVGRNSAISAYFSGTGALYRYYSAYGTSSAVSGSDEFYYEPKSSSKNYDLADVTYVTTRFAKAGDTVYIPFTAYGTKSEKVTGTVAIKIKQTMNFTDVHTYDYFYDSVQWAVNNNVTAGTSATTFSPSQSCTRAQIVTFLWRAAGSPEPRSTSNPFTDVSATRDADYYKAILWAVENKITTGTSATTFSPSGTCTRAQIVTFLYRYKGSPSVSGSLSFTDVSKTTHSAYYNAILWAVRNSVTTGNGNNTFAPSATCNRGEAVTFLYRALA